MPTAENLTEALLRMNQRFHQVYHHRAVKRLSRMEFILLKLLEHAQEKEKLYTVSTLARKLEVSNPAISRKLKEMTEKGYVERQDDPKDRRTTYVRLAPAGQAILQAEFEQTKHFTRAALERLSEQEVADFIRIGNLLADAMQSVSQEEKGEHNG